MKILTLLLFANPFWELNFFMLEEKKFRSEVKNLLEEESK